MSDITPSSQYLNDCHRNFSMYVLQTRGFPSIIDGLKHGGRRLLWTARDGSKYKTASLAGATMPLHPHADASDTVDTLTKPYCNNYPLFSGYGAFGTRLKPNAAGAPRYTAVTVSPFTKDVVFRDIELIPMVENYDGELMEPKHFLPLIPIALVNPSEGIGVGFASKIYPRSLGDIITGQLTVLAGKKLSEEEPAISFMPFQSTSVSSEVIKSGNTRYWFEGQFERLDTSSIRVFNIPYGLDHMEFIEHLNELKEEDTIASYEDRSSNVIDITIKFGRGALKHQTDAQLMRCLKLRASVVENMNLVDFDGDKVVSLTYNQVITLFTEWRLNWYLTRYERLKELLERDIQRYRDVILAIKEDVGHHGRLCADRAQLKEWLAGIGVVYTDYVSDLPMYRLTGEEAKKVAKKLEEALVQLEIYQSYIDNPDERKRIYVQELKEIKKKYADAGFIAPPIVKEKKKAKA